MWLAIDRDALHEIGGEWFFGYKGGTGWTFPEQAFQLPQDEVDARLVFDRPAAEAEAKRLMEEAGYADGIQNVDLLWRAGPFREAAAQVAQLEFERILGIESEVRRRRRSPSGSRSWPTGTSTSRSAALPLRSSIRPRT